MRVAVTGGTGFVGAALVRAHLARGDDVRVLTRRLAAAPPGGARLLRGDLATGEIPKAFVDRVDVLYHCAGELKDPGRMEAVHVNGTRRLLDAAAGSVGRWVQLSSVGVYGPLMTGLVTEETAEAPVGPYEITKAASDALVREAHARRAIEAAVLRPSIVFGPTMPNRSLFALIDAVNRGLFFFVGPPGASANYVPLETVVDALLACGNSARAAGEVFNISAFSTMETFVGAIASALGKPAPRLRLPRAPLRVAASVFGAVPGWPLTASRVDALSSRAVYSTARIESILGIRPAITVDAALRATVDAWRAGQTPR